MFGIFKSVTSNSSNSSDAQEPTKRLEKDTVKPPTKNRRERQRRPRYEKKLPPITLHELRIYNGSSNPPYPGLQLEDSFSTPYGAISRSRFLDVMSQLRNEVPTKTERNALFLLCLMYNGVETRADGIQKFTRNYQIREVLEHHGFRLPKIMRPGSTVEYLAALPAIRKGEFRIGVGDCVRIGLGTFTYCRMCELISAPVGSVIQLTAEEQFVVVDLAIDYEHLSVLVNVGNQIEIRSWNIRLISKSFLHGFKRLFDQVRALEQANAQEQQPTQE